MSNNYIIEGHLDRILLRPVNGLFQLYTSQLALEDMTDTLIGLAIIFYASYYLSIQWGLLELIGLLLFVISGVCIFLGIFTTLACLSFWFSDRVGFIPPIYNMMQFGRYPLTIYNPVLRFILSWVIPFGFVGFYPATWFIRREEFIRFIIMTPLVAFCCLIIGILTWHFGIRRYESTGS